MIFTIEEQVKFGLPKEDEIDTLAEEYLDRTIQYGTYNPGTEETGMPDQPCLCLIATCVAPALVCTAEISPP